MITKTWETRTKTLAKGESQVFCTQDVRLYSYESLQYEYMTYVIINP